MVYKSALQLQGGGAGGAGFGVDGSELQRTWIEVCYKGSITQVFNEPRINILISSFFKLSMNLTYQAQIYSHYDSADVVHFIIAAWIDHHG